MIRHLTVALRYARLGWKVLPLGARRKTPLGSVVPHGVLDATTDESLIRRWWWAHQLAGVGIATGLGSGLLVVDLDGPEGVASWQALLREHGPVPSLTQRTGSGGYQVIYQRPETPEKLGNRARLKPGLDIRGDGGYIVAPPSIHPCGVRYRWVRRLPPAPAPAWLVSLLQSSKAPEHRHTRRLSSGPATSVGAARLEALCGVVSSACTGQRNHCLYWASLCALESVEAGEISCADAITALSAAAESNGLDVREIRLAMRSLERAM
jgi:hypothetical protein